MENNENSKNLINSTASASAKLTATVAKSGRSAKQDNKRCRQRSDVEVLEVIDGMKARIKQLLDETNQLKTENNKLRKQLTKNPDKRLWY